MDQFNGKRSCISKKMAKQNSEYSVHIDKKIPPYSYSLLIRVVLSVFICETFVMIIISRETACRGTSRDFLVSGFVCHKHGQEMQS